MSRAVVIGAMNMDVLAVAGQPAIAGDSTPGATTFCAGGVGRNIAEALSRLSVNTQLFSIVGNDTTADRLLAQCREAGIDCSQVQMVAGHTSSYVAIHDVDGGLLNAINAMSITEQLDIDQLPELNSCLNPTDICVLDANLGRAFIDKLSQKDFTCELAADTVSVAKCRRLLPLLSRLNLLKVNRAEAVALTDSQCDVSNDSLLAGLLQLGCKQVLMTLGESGSTMATEQLTVRADATAVASIQTVNGAGDSLFAGVIAGMLAGQSLQQQLQWGSAAAALSLQTTEACSPDLSLRSLQSFT